MIVAPKRPCARPGCRHFAPCPVHAQRQNPAAKLYDQERGTSAERGYGSRWRKEARGYLAEHPFCVGCESKGRTKIAKLVDHIVPVSVAPERFWDRSNWQSLCRAHHNRKTAAEARGRYIDYRERLRRGRP